jgi:peptide/nickel transport system substrate-binding protein
MTIIGHGPDQDHTNAETFRHEPSTHSDNARRRRWPGGTGWDIPEMTKTTEAAVREKDAKKREAIYQQIQREHQRSSPFVILFQQSDVAAHQKGVDGFIMGPSFENNLYYAIKK